MIRTLDNKYTEWGMHYGFEDRTPKSFKTIDLSFLNNKSSKPQSHGTLSFVANNHPDFSPHSSHHAQATAEGHRE